MRDKGEIRYLRQRKNLRYEEYIILREGDMRKIERDIYVRDRRDMRKLRANII